MLWGWEGNRGSAETTDSHCCMRDYRHQYSLSADKSKSAPALLLTIIVFHL